MPARLPDGCAFHPRCAFAEEKFRNSVPPLSEVAMRGMRNLFAPEPATVAARSRTIDADSILIVENLRTDVVAGAGGMFLKHLPVYAVDGVSLEIMPGRTLGLWSVAVR
jgi:peptide/nickel transport system ATP-binding protein